MQFSTQELIFTYQEGKHLQTTLSIKNTQNYNQLYKFKISTINRFMIKPNTGSLQPGEQVNVEVVIHKEIVSNYANQRIQLIYGKNLEDSKSVKSMIFPIVVSGISSNLNLTMMVESKHNRVKELETQVQNFKMMPTTSAKPPKKSKAINFIIKLLIVIVIGLLIGFFGPLKIFKKKVVVQKGWW